MLSLVFGWEAFIPLQIIGFVVLSLGAFTFGEAISFRKCFPSLYPPEAPVSDAEQPLLSRLPPRIDHNCIVISHPPQPERAGHSVRRPEPHGTKSFLGQVAENRFATIKLPGLATPGNTTHGNKHGLKMQKKMFPFYHCQWHCSPTHLYAA